MIYHRLVFNGHGVVALKFNALVLAFRLEETEVWLKQMEVFDGPYCANVGFVLRPLHIPLC